MNFKNTLRLMATTLFVALATISCEETNTGNGGKEPAEKVEGFTLKTKGSSVDNLSVEVEVTSAEVENYIVAMMTKSDFASDYDSDLVAAADGATTALVADKAIDFAVVDEEYVFSGDATVDLASAWELKAGTSYVVLVYGIDALGAQTTAVAWKNVSTQRESQYSEYVDYLFINEVDPNDDWVELYNADRESISLGDFYLMNEAGDRVELSGKVSSMALVSFDCSVNGHGDVITLYDGDDKIVDDIEIPSTLGTSSSYGRATDGADAWKEFTEPSRDASNGMIAGGNDAFKIVTIYATEDQVAFYVEPSEAVELYTYYFIEKDVYYDASNGYGGNANALADDMASLYRDDLKADFTSNNGVTMFYGPDFIDPSYYWGVKPNTDYVFAFFGIDENGDRNTNPAIVEVTTEGTHAPKEEAYIKWLGTWSVTSDSSYAGKSYTFDVTVTPYIDDFTYVIGGMAPQGADLPVIGYLTEDGSIQIYSHNLYVYGMMYPEFAPEGKTEGEMAVVANGEISSEPGTPYWISGYYPAFTIESTGAKAAEAVGYKGELSNGGTFSVTNMALIYNVYGTGSYYNYGVVAPFEDDDFPKGPYTFEKTSDEVAEPESAPRRAMSKGANKSFVPNIFNAAMNKAMNAGALRVAKAPVKF